MMLAMMNNPSFTPLQIPAVPDPVAVTLNIATTALVVQDMTDVTCGPQPNCLAMVGGMAALIRRARAAGVTVAYTVGSAGGTPLPEMATAPGDPIVQGAQNKFRHTMLDDFLRDRGIQTVILAGWRANGSILFTAHGATVLRYTVVIPTDATGAAQDHDYAIGLYMVLNLINANPTNEPLKKGAVTLSRTDLISFA
jgi:nicotinamidase-related amidase